MSALLALIVPFAFYWLILFVSCFAVVEFGQNYLYDEATTGAAARVALGSALLAIILTWARPEYHLMFTSGLGRTVVLCVVAFGVFSLILGFQPWHALPIGLGTVLLVSGLATMGVESFGNRNRPASAVIRTPSTPIRRSGGAIPVRTPEAKPNEKEKAAAK